MTHGEVDGAWRQRIVRSFRSIPVDGLLVVGYVTAIAASFYVLGVGGLARTLLGVPLVLFLPGYVLVATLFPERPATAQDREWSPVALLDGGTPGWYERLALSLAVSLAVLPVFGLVLATTRWGFTQSSVLVSLGAFTILGVLAAAVRRLRLPRDRRYDVPLRTMASDSRRGIFGPEARFDVVLNVVLLLSIVAAMSVLGYALVTSQGSAATTEFQLLTQGDDGEFVESGYPDEIPPDESAELAVGITNFEGERVTYTVVVEVHRIEDDGSSLEVLERSELTRLEATAEHGETVRREHTISPTMTGETLRINYYLYRGDAPEEAGADTADQHLWITVDGSG